MLLLYKTSFLKNRFPNHGGQSVEGIDKVVGGGIVRGVIPKADRRQPKAGSEKETPEKTQQKTHEFFYNLIKWDIGASVILELIHIKTN